MQKVRLLTMFLIMTLTSLLTFSQTSTLWSDDFENDPSSRWSATAGVWEMGVPTSGPNAAHGGTQCAATILNGNYPVTADTRLTRLSYFTVPAANQNPRLRFWHWFSFSTADYGKVQVKVQGTSDWIDVSGQYVNTGSSVWSYASRDLSAYAGQTIQIAFYFHAVDGSVYSDESTGWYIDDVSLITGPLTFINPETWENGIGDWYAEAGTWEVGVPTSGPSAAHGGSNCAGTVLAGNYAVLVDSRLVSPFFTVPSANQNPRLRFWHWFSFSSSDYGKVQIHVKGSSELIDVSGQYVNTGSSTWSCPSIDLSAYAGQTIRIAFYFHAGDGSVYSDESTGWYIDDISLVTGPLTFNNPETWENGIGDWNAESGTWEVGSPTSGPGSPHGGSNCAGTVLTGNYEVLVDSRLASPSFTVPSINQNPRLRFWHWFSFSTADYGKVQVKVQGTSDWIDVSGQYVNTGSSVWTYRSVDLSAYAGQTIQIAFYFHAGDGSVYSDESTGWYIDDVSLITGSLTFNNPETWENGIGDWFAEAGTWEVGAPTSGPGSPHGGSNCAGTVLAGNYAVLVDSRLVSPFFTVPSANQNPRLRFWHWFSFSTADFGKVQIHVQGTSELIDVSGQYVNTGSSTWSCPSIDLSAYAGQTIRIAFYFHAGDGSVYSDESTGWYIDDISLVTGPLTFNNPETWENGIGDWNAESGTWEVGIPTSGPNASHGGSNCAGTSLAGNYGVLVDSKLISPPIQIPVAIQNPYLRFWHWYSFSSGDFGKVMIKVDGNNQWQDISENYINTSGSVWSYPAIDLSGYSGNTVRIAFEFYAADASVYSDESAGWYIDDIIITGACTPPSIQASAFTSSVITSNSMTTGWTRGDGTGVLVVARAGGPVNADPVNGTIYAGNAAFGSGTQIGTGNYVVYNGTGTSVNVINLNPGTVYHYAIYEYSTTNCYKTPALTGNATTLTTSVKTLGNTTVYSSSSTTANRRALPITFAEAGSIQSISIYHNGGTGSILLGVYSDQTGAPTSRLGVTPVTTINSTAGWQTVSLTSPVTVASGQTVWLAWVFQTNPGVRYITGTPARAESPSLWAGGMPDPFGTASYANYKYSIYCTYTEAASFLTVSTTSITLGSASGTSGTFNITSNTTWSITDDAGWLDVSPVSGTNDGTITVTANSANTGAVPRSATVTITGTGVTNKTVTVTQQGGGKTLGNTTVYSSSSTTANRRALPVTFTEAGSVQSISIYHNGGTGSVLLGVYSDQTGAPTSRLGVTPATTINSTAGWQTVSLTSPVTVASGQTVWLAWVFQTNPGVRYITGTPARAESPSLWAGGMPDPFGTASYANYKYSIYCTYTEAASFLTVSTTSITLGSASGSNGTFDITSNTTWSITDDAGWLDVSPVSGTNNGTITVTANSANTGAVPRSATVTITGTGVADKTVTVTQQGGGKTLGNTTVYSSSSTTANRRALPVTFTEAGSIQSITIYHNGGTGSILLGVYSDQTGAPTSRLGVTPATTINSTAGWQTVSLTSPVAVASGQTVWLAWVFQTNPGVRYITGTPARAESPSLWAGGMPDPFGTASYANYKYSVYCTYTEAASFLTVSTTSITLGSASGTSGTFNITSNTTWSITDDAGWLDVSPVSGTNDGTITVTANSANTGAVPRSATVTITGTGVADKTVTVTQQGGGKTLGNTTVYSSSSTTANRRALPVTFTEAGSVQSISIYHNGGTGNILLGIYSDQTGAPNILLGVTAATPINSTEGWQTVALTSPEQVTMGQTVWLAWVFETNPGVRYITGTPARAQSSASWAGGMPATFGTATYANYKYSLYCTYTTGNTETLGNTDIYSLSSTTANRRAMPVTFTEAGSIQSISIYHNGGTGSVLSGVYSDVGGIPSSLIGVTGATLINSISGWQTVALTNPVQVALGQTVWLAWVFETNPGVRYITGTPARAQSPASWIGGMPATFGTATYANYKYSIYCTYITSGGDEVKSVDEPLDIRSAYMDKEDVLIYPNPTAGEITVTWKNRYSNRLDIKIYNMLGKAVREVQTDPDVNEIRLDLNGTSSGVYLFEMKDKKNNLILNRSRIIRN